MTPKLTEDMVLSFVRIREDLEVGEIYGKRLFDHQMLEYAEQHNFLVPIKFVISEITFKTSLSSGAEK